MSPLKNINSTLQEPAFAVPDDSKSFLTLISNKFIPKSSGIPLLKQEISANNFINLFPHIVALVLKKPEHGYQKTRKRS